MIFIGIDIGTQGIKTIAVTEKGEKISFINKKLTEISNLKEGWKEQNPLEWEETLKISLKEISKDIIRQGYKLSEIRAISVDGTSGTILAIDRENTPLMNAIMYNDSRATGEAEKIKEIAMKFSKKVGYTFNSSFTLPKILWIKNNLPDIYSKTTKFVHQTDFIIGILTGIYNITDHSNALKTGFDLVDYKWPEFIYKDLQIDIKKLPDVVKPGSKISTLSKEIAEETGLLKNTIVVAGMTDGCAGQIASGAVKEGEWNSILGTTLVIKGITKDLIIDPKGRVYSHLHPEGLWMPGGASNTGGECLEKVFPSIDFQRWNQEAEKYLPSSLVIYPLVRKGERFPFIDSDAEGFIRGYYQNEYELYLGYLEGVGLIERLCYNVVGSLGASINEKIFVTGGAAKSELWLKIRASILNKKLVVPEISEPSMGSAIIAASKTFYNDIFDAASNMVRLKKIVEPESKLVKVYDEKYHEFIRLMKEKGYILEE
ncbi:pentulose/hexulose kinase [Thermoanaerobacter sp. YS13]|uniref:FGGY-family carbohydrate kinase n=1 Tax=Thermoanaerobacter sp. YS13 TaxID=1511746 RepID=UPI000575185A|nr:FGGY-family carbohydrate kinase [Thermoanaerobacter sp. YS13]KHO61416.1 pentulose/hexulose kinase [Thermoanaerobacter sp. YS13]